jgi:hypothetical protein
MLRFVVDWIAHGHPSSPIKVELPVARDASSILQFRQRQEDLARALTPRERGIRFHRDEFERLFQRVERWTTVEFVTTAGLPIECVDDLPRGADGGIDVIVRITAPTERGARNIAGRIRGIMVHQRYE